MEIAELEERKDSRHNRDIHHKLSSQDSHTATRSQTLTHLHVLNDEQQQKKKKREKDRCNRSAEQS